MSDDAIKYERRDLYEQSGQRRRVWCFRSAAVCLGLVLAMMAAEVAIRLITPQNLSGWWRDLDEHGLSINVPTHTARHQLGDRVAYYRMDAHGLRSLGDGEASRGTRVLCVGDSFTFGWLLTDEHTYISLLQRYADESFGRGMVTLLNGGHGGWGASDYVRFVEEYGQTLDVDAVMVFFNAGDIDRSMQSRRYLVDADGGLNKVPSRPRNGLKQFVNGIPGYNWLLEHSHLVQLLRNSPSTSGKRVEPDRAPSIVVSEAAQSNEAYDYTRKLLSRLKQLTDQRSQRLMMLTTGFMQRGNAVNMRRISVMCYDVGVHFYDISAQLEKSVGGDYADVVIPFDGHPNEQGARMIADLNWPYVEAFLGDILKASALSHEHAPRPAEGGTER